MSPTTHVSRLAAAGFTLFALSVPATAGASDLGAARNDVPEPRPDIGRLLNDIDTPIVPDEAKSGTSSVDGTSTVPAESGSVELLQITLGALGGAAITAGGAAVLVHRRRHHMPHPA